MFDQRINILRQTFDNCQIDSLLISNFYNILYLTGFKTLTENEREAFVLITKNSVYLFTDGRYLSKNTSLSGFELILLEPGKGLIYHLQNIIKDNSILKLGFESDDLRYFEFQRMQQLLAGIILQPTEKLVIKTREAKEQEEIRQIRKACLITDQCLLEIQQLIKVGMSEKHIAYLLESLIKQKGYDLAFDPIVAVNENSAIPHYHTKSGKGSVEKESVILIDFGVKYKDYLSDITRMFFFNPASGILETYDKLLKAQNKTVTILNSLKDPKSVDFYCRNLLQKSGLAGFPHSLGHGVGLQIHEYPKLSQVSTDSLYNGQVFTIEPGVYVEGQWGMRIEDTVALVNGKAEVLTKFSKEPIILS